MDTRGLERHTMKELFSETHLWIDPGTHAAWRLLETRSRLKAVAVFSAHEGIKEDLLRIM